MSESTDSLVQQNLALQGEVERLRELLREARDALEQAARDGDYHETFLRSPWTREVDRVLADQGYAARGVPAASPEVFAWLESDELECWWFHERYGLHDDAHHERHGARDSVGLVACVPLYARPTSETQSNPGEEAKREPTCPNCGHHRWHKPFDSGMYCENCRTRLCQFCHRWRCKGPVCEANPGEEVKPRCEKCDGTGWYCEADHLGDCDAAECGAGDFCPECGENP